MTEASIASEVSAPDAHVVEIPPAHRSKEQQVADILAGQSAPDEEAPETEPAADAPAAETPLTLAALAEKLGTDAAKLYDLEIPLADGATLKLGELKDAHKAAKALEADRSKVNEERAQSQADRIRDERQLNELLASISPDAISPELHQAWQRQQSEQLSREHEALLRRMPEWSDRTVVQRDMAAMVEVGKSYGLSETELGTIRDHRVLALLRDHAKLKAATSKAPAAPAPKAGIRPRVSQAPSKAQEVGRIKAAVASRQISPVTGVERILKGL